MELTNLSRLNDISIHTPTKGVTRKKAVEVIIISISIHTPTKGVTVCGKSHARFRDISIHTPTKGVTIFPRKSIADLRNFNPHSHEGSDYLEKSILY